MTHVVHQPQLAHNLVQLAVPVVQEEAQEYWSKFCLMHMTAGLMAEGLPAEGRGLLLRSCSVRHESSCDAAAGNAFLPPAYLLRPSYYIGAQSGRILWPAQLF
jgi:hypothetical protein